MRSTYKLIIAGTRTFNDHNLMRKEVIKFINEHNINESSLEIISGGARGADRLGELYAKHKNYDLIIMSADWDTYGKAAGYRRNAKMAKYADGCIVFWDGVSRGTKHMIDLANKEELDLKIVKYK